MFSFTVEITVKPDGREHVSYKSDHSFTKVFWGAAVFKDHRLKK